MLTRLPGKAVEGRGFTTDDFFTADILVYSILLLDRPSTIITSSALDFALEEPIGGGEDPLDLDSPW